MKHVFVVTLALTSFAAAAAPAAAQERTDSARIEELRGQIDAITRELERMNLGREVVEADSSIHGFGPAASKVYRVGQGVSIGGYGEFLFEGYADEREDGSDSGKSDQLDALRAIVYVGYKFNDRILFNSELEFEHGSTGQAGSASVEFAYLDYLLGDGHGLRGGMLLMPMGFTNEFHEPPSFLGTERPLTESRIIPTTWRENGLGIFGGSDHVAYRAYLVSSFDGVGDGSSKAKGFSDEGLRGGRQKGSKAVAEDWGLVGRLDYVGTLGFTAGAAAFYGQTAQNRELDGQVVDGGTFIWDAHVQYKARGWELRGMVARATVDQAAELNALKGLTGDDSIGDELLGWYLEAGYDVLRARETRHQLIPYLRYERVVAQRSVPDGFAFNPANDLSVLSVGAAWKPILNVVLKSDYQIHANAANTGVNQLNVALGYLF